MRNSAWYHKLWQRKLNDLPIKVNEEQAWGNMQTLLDKHMPVEKPARRMAKPIAATIVSLLRFVLPVAAMAGTAAYIGIKVYKHDKIKLPVKKHMVVAGRPVKKVTIAPDSTKALFNTNSIKNTLLNDSLIAGGITLPVDVAKRKLSTGNVTKLAIPNTAMGKTGVLLLNQNAFYGTNRYNKSKAVTGNYNKRNNHSETYFKGGITSLDNRSTFSSKNGQLAVNPKASHSTNIDSLIPISPAGMPLVVKMIDWKPVFQIADRPVLAAKNGFKVTSNGQLLGSVKKKQSSPISLFAGLGYGVKLGINLNNKPNLFFGGYINQKITNRLSIQPEVTLNLSVPVAGGYSYPNNIKPDSLLPIEVTNLRRLMVLNIPLLLQYQLSNKLSIKAGPVIGFAINERKVTSTISNQPVVRDTLTYTDQVGTGLNQTTLNNKFTLGLSGGVNYYFKPFFVEAGYLYNFKYYRVSSAAGAYNYRFNALQINVGYRFK